MVSYRTTRIRVVERGWRDGLPSGCISKHVFARLAGMISGYIFFFAAEKTIIVDLWLNKL